MIVPALTAKFFFGRKSVIALLIFLGIFAWLFLQFPLHDSLPGNCDTGLVISVSNIYLNLFKRIFFGEEIGHAMYPVTNEQAFGESAPGVCVLFILFKLILNNDLYAYYAYITLIFTFNGWAVFLLARFFCITPAASFLAGFIFSYNNFAFTNIDDSLVFFYAISVISFMFLKAAFHCGRKKYFIAGSMLLGIQAYFSIYVFVFSFIILFIMFFRKNSILYLVKTAATAIAVSLPVTLVYFATYIRGDYWTPELWNYEKVGRVFSLEARDLLKKLPGLIPVESMSYRDLCYFVRTRTAGYIGFAPYLLGFGYILSKPVSIRIKITLLFFFLFGIGTFYSYLGMARDVPVLKLIYAAVKFIRIPLRGYFVFLLILSVLSGAMVMAISKKINIYFISLPVLIFHFADSTPFPMKKFYLGKYLSPPEAVTGLFLPSDKVLFLPSSTYCEFLGDTADLFHYNREIIYMNWQTHLKCNVLNGVNGYQPVARNENQALIAGLSKEGNLTALIAKNELDYIVFDQRLVLEAEEDSTLLFLKNFNTLRLLSSNKNIFIFKTESESAKP